MRKVDESPAGIRRRLAKIRDMRGRLAAEDAKLAIVEATLAAVLAEQEDADGDTAAGERLLQELGQGGNTEPDTNMSAPQAKSDHDEGTIRRINGIRASHRAAHGSAFLRWLGTRDLDTWAAAHNIPVGERDAGEPLSAHRLRSYLRAPIGTRVRAPSWLRSMVFKESRGEVTFESWDAEWPYEPRGPRKQRKGKTKGN